MALDQNGQGHKLYRCHHRGQGCAQPRRSNHGLLRAAVLGLELIDDDARRSRHVVDDLQTQRRKLLRLYYDDKIGADRFAEEEARLSVAIREAQRESELARVESARSDKVERHFDDVAAVLATLDVKRTWEAATEVERLVLIDEFLEEITVLPDYLDVKVHGAPALHVLYQEVGLKNSEFDRVGGANRTFRTSARLRGKVLVKAA